MFLRQSTAATVEVGQFVGTDGITEKTALTSQTGRYIINGTSASLTPSSWSHTANGNYAVGLSTTHTGTVGRLKITFTDAATYLQVEAYYTVLSANVYDALFGSTALSTHTAANVAALILTTPANLLTTDASGRVQVQVGTSAGQINSSSGKVPATLASTDVTGNVAADLQTIKTQTVTCAAGVTVPSSLASPTNITAASGITLAAVTHTGATIPTVTTVTTTTNLTNAPTAGDFTSTMKSSLNAATPASVTGSVGSIATGGITATSIAANAITAAKIATDAIGAAQLAADAVTEIQSGLSTYAGGDTSGTTTLLSRLSSTRAGYLDNLSAGAVALASQIPANFTTATFASAGVFATAALANAPGGSAPSAATVAAAVWDLTTTGHTTGGTFGAAMNAAGSAGDPWSTSLPGAYSAGSAGYILGTNLNATVTSRMATYAQPTGFLAATFPTTVASTTNITAASGVVLSGVTHTGAVIPTVTTVGTLTTYTGNTPQTGDAYARIGLAGVGLTNLGDTRIANLDGTITSRMATFSYTAPDNTSITAIKAKTDHLPSSDIVHTLGKLWVLDGNGNAVAPASATTAIDAKTSNLPASPAAVGSAMTLDKTQTLSAARDITAVADTSLTLNDALHCAIASAAGKETIVGTTYTVKTPSTGTTVRVFTLDDANDPTSRT